MVIFGVELDLDFCDADQEEVYEREVRRVMERAQDKKQYDGKSNAEGIRIQCRIVDDFFDAVFGMGTADRLFHGKTNLREHMEAFGAVSDAAKESNAELLSLADRYSPNRAARRLAEKRQKKSGYTHMSGHSCPTGPIGDKGPTGPKGIHDVALASRAVEDSSMDSGRRPTQEQIAFIEKFAQLLPEMDAFLQSRQGRQGG